MQEKMKAEHEIELDVKGNWKPVKGLKKEKDTVRVAEGDIILTAVYLID